MDIAVEAATAADAPSTDTMRGAGCRLSQTNPAKGIRFVRHRRGVLANLGEQQPIRQDGGAGDETDMDSSETEAALQKCGQRDGRSLRAMATL
jgi:hypothetical protein